MPRGDRTGPIGAGPRTGRSLGYCTGHDTPGYTYPGTGPFSCGRGAGHGFGCRHRSYPASPVGWRHPDYASPRKEETLSDLKANAEWLKGELDAVTKRIEELE